MANLPSQDELRRRLRAGRVLADLTVAELAGKVDPEAGLGERTLRKLESGETQIRTPVLRELAWALGLPYAWFTVESIPAQFRPGDEQWYVDLAALAERQAAFEREIRGEGSNGDSPQTPSATQPAGQRRGPRGTRQVR